MQNAKLKAAIKSELELMLRSVRNGVNVTDDIIDELGDYFESIQTCTDKDVVEAYTHMRDFVDESTAEQHTALLYALGKLA